VTEAGADTFPVMRRIWAPVLGLAMAVASVIPARTAPSAIPRGLPHHFAIGVAGEPDATGIYGWMPKTHIPFDYAYQYLAGGVNTGQGWQTWNTNATFPLSYARGAHRHGYISVFTYYMLRQSHGPCDSCPEAQVDLANLNSQSTMAALYRDFATLMRRLGPRTYGGVQGYGRTAIVHVEPDLSGYAQEAVLQPSQSCYGFCTGQGNDPALMKASVQSSGVKDVATYPNTYRGFSLAMVHLRDVYAPNVRLAFHVSDWTTGYDIGSQTQKVDAAAVGRKAGTFAARAGASSYDLVFNDVADRDAGYYQHVYGADVWWDRRNVQQPAFRRWERYIAAIHATTHRPVMVWQIPLGNQYFRTENDTDGHYQDNRAEYFFHHVGELVHSGVVALLFGAGNGGSTVNFDGKDDGVTNPSPTCNRDGTSGKAICASRVSRVADDDGGYLRMMAKAYYRHPMALP
jgi:hypothetical protein